MSDAEQDGRDSAHVTGFGNIVALGRSQITIYRRHVSVWVLALVVVISLAAAAIVVWRLPDPPLERMEGSFNVAVAAFERQGDAQFADDDALGATSDAVFDFIADLYRDDDAVEVWSRQRSKIDTAFEDRNHAAARATEIDADVVIAARLRDADDGLVTVEFRAHAFGDAARAAPPLSIDLTIASDVPFDPKRPALEMNRELVAVALDDMIRALQALDGDDFWGAAAALDRPRRDDEALPHLAVLRGLIYLRWASADVTRGPPLTEPPPESTYTPPVEGLLAGARNELERGPNSFSQRLFLLDVRYLDLVLPDRDDIPTPSEWTDLASDYASARLDGDTLSSVYTELMLGNIAATSALSQGVREGDRGRRHFESVIGTTQRAGGDVFQPFESAAWAGIGAIELTSEPADYERAIEAYRAAREDATPVFWIRYSNGLAIALLQLDRHCEALDALESASERAGRLALVVPDEHQQLLDLATEGCLESDSDG